jgi:type II secretory pathway component PulF
MLFNYNAITNVGEKKSGSVEATSKDLAISAIQRRGLILVSISEEKAGGFLGLSFLDKKVSMKDIVIMSRQISTLFEAQVTALKAFNLLATNTDNPSLVKVLNNISQDLQTGSTISVALSKYPDVFSEFYVNMVKAGEESGKLTQVFSYLADYLERQYQLSSKTKSAMIYPSFVIGVFVLVMVAMFVFIVPKLSEMIKQSGQDVPIMTQAVMFISDLLVNYGLFVLVALIIFVVYLFRFSKTKMGKRYFDGLKIKFPIIKNIFSKLYLSRIADNMDTMLSSGIPIIRAIELTSSVVGNVIFQEILSEAVEKVKGGSSFSESLSKHEEIPQIMVGMIHTGEETGSVGNILKTLGNFYNKEVNSAVDTMVALIEPVMLVVLGLGVGVLMAAVLVPIYNISGGIS